jgi:hypothetical protein
MAKASMPFSLDEQDILFVKNYSPSTNVSENMRLILKKAREESAALVQFNRLDIEEGNYTPIINNPKAFLIFQKTNDTVEYGDKVTFPRPKKASVEKLVELAEIAGLRTFLVEYTDLGFTSLWAVNTKEPETISPCIACKEKIRKSVEKSLEVLDEIVC